jgi:site-specific recombinase
VKGPLRRLCVSTTHRPDQQHTQCFAQPVFGHTFIVVVFTILSFLLAVFAIVLASSSLSVSMSAEGDQSFWGEVPQQPESILGAF